jgi:hypothetical protein
MMDLKTFSPYKVASSRLIRPSRILAIAFFKTWEVANLRMSLQKPVLISLREGLAMG